MTDDLDLITKLRHEVEALAREVVRGEVLVRQALKEHTETREHLSQVILDNSRMQAALRWYLDDDRRSVEHGILETVAMRPAFEALGGEPSRICSAHREPSRTCLTCYPSPPRPRLVSTVLNARP